LLIPTHDATLRGFNRICLMTKTRGVAELCRTIAPITLANVIRSSSSALWAVLLVLGLSLPSTTPASAQSATHYQARLVPTCGGTNGCNGDFKTPAAGTRHRVTRISCIFVGSAGSEFSHAFVLLKRNSDDKSILAQYLPLGSSSSNGAHLFNSAVDFDVSPTQRLQITMILATGTSVSADCGATGVVEN
jgi:hypothetical protein